MIHWLEPALKGSAYTQCRTVCERRSLTLCRWQNWRAVEIDMPIGSFLLHAEFEMQRDVLIDLKMWAIKALIVMRIVASLIRAAEDDLCDWVSLEGYQFT